MDFDIEISKGTAFIHWEGVCAKLVFAKFFNGSEDKTQSSGGVFACEVPARRNHEFIETYRIPWMKLKYPTPVLLIKPMTSSFEQVISIKNFVVQKRWLEGDQGKWDPFPRNSIRYFISFSCDGFEKI